jgi:hypothetical protein
LVAAHRLKNGFDRDGRRQAVPPAQLGAEAALQAHDLRIAGVVLPKEVSEAAWTGFVDHRANPILVVLWLVKPS